ncbi:Nonaspanin [Trema orientale]|uniref:Transmembrane 9 superfamily member n=1 Tax=Trema orientale TaxID=63057 RepID=A0A2P5ADF7_TREOI|nr:Nonaspanin [Trema orientale]
MAYDERIHWLYIIINSLVYSLGLFFAIAIFVVRTLNRDIHRYNQLEIQLPEDTEEDKAWKLIKGDVFRPPSNSDLLCVHVGTGVQIFWTIVVTLIFASLGFLPKASSKPCEFMTTILLLWLFVGIFAGYSSVRLYKMFNKTEWKKIAPKTAFMFPSTFYGLEYRFLSFFLVRILVLIRARQ